MPTKIMQGIFITNISLQSATEERLTARIPADMFSVP